MEQNFKITAVVKGAGRRLYAVVDSRGDGVEVSLYAADDEETLRELVATEDLDGVSWVASAEADIRRRTADAWHDDELTSVELGVTA